MNIEKIEIENFRGFEGKHEIICQPNLNLFVGANGSGKSAILDLIGAFIAQFISDVNTDSSLKAMNTEGNVNQTPSLTIKKFLKLKDINHKYFYTDNKCYIGSEKYFIKEYNNNCYLYLNRENNSRGYTYTGGSDSPLSLSLADIYTQKINIPILRYFGATAKNNLQEDEKTSNVFYGYENFYSPINNFDYFVNWFVRRENFENREKIRKKNLDYQDNHLATVRNAIHIFLGYFQYAVFQNIRVENDEATNGNLENLCIDKNGVTFNLAQLSKGEQFILLLVADIAQRLAIANPSRENALEGNGIVLIDEMEIHLHPAWQREVLPCLLQTFPNIQFFITTHSPQIVSSIDKKNVYIIDSFKFYQTSHQTKGRDTNSLLNEIFGVRERPEYAFKDFQQLYELIDDPDTEGAAAEKLEAMRQTYGEDDPDWQRAKMHFEFLTAKTVE